MAATASRSRRGRAAWVATSNGPACCAAAAGPRSSTRRAGTTRSGAGRARHAAELYDGKPSTYWREDLASSGEGQFFTITSRAASTQAVQVRIQAAAGRGLDGALQHASSVATRTRLILASAQARDPAARPVVAQAIAKGQVDERQLDQVLAALGASGVFAPELHDLLAKKQLAQAHRAAAAAALADSVTHAKSDPALLLDLAGDGDLAQRRAIIAGLATLPVGTLLP